MITLSNQDQFSFNYHLNGLDFCKKDINELIALLRYRDTKMIRHNKTRALADIKLIIDNLNELKAAIENIN